ncbi:hypothetical protein K0U00_26865, partial [Paenibacillus sepulcri]|nr:hypothetical protein [Paenibacillus sepulcri]
MWKMAGWLGRAVAAGLIISFLSIWTTGYVVNSYVETLLKQYNIPLEQTPFAMSGVWGGLWGADQAPEKSASQETASGNQESENQESDNASQTGSEADSTAGTDDSVIPGLGDSSSNTDNTVTEEDSTAEAGDSSGSSSDGAGEEPSGNSDVTSTSETSGGSGTPPADEDAAGPGGEDTPLAVDAFGDEPGT